MNPSDVAAIFSSRLAQARRMRGLSLRDLSDALAGAVSYNALHKYEKGEMMPDGSVLTKLCAALGQRPDFFFRPTTVNLTNVEFRKKASFKAKEEESLKEQSADFFERYLEVEQIVGVAGTFENPINGCEINKAGDIELAANRLREAWDLGNDPIPAVLALLEEKYLKVYEADASDEFEGFSGHAGELPIIVLNKNRPPDRKRLTALHELGHLVLRFASHFSAREIEELCHAFAAALLIPEASFGEVFGGKRKHSTTRELVTIKERWGISCSATMMRAARLGLIAPSALKRFFTLWNEWGYRKNEPGVWHGLELAHRFEALIHRAASQGLITLTKGAYLAGQSLDTFRRSLQPVP